jgi:hypothetical protein
MPRYSYECPAHGMFELSLRLADWDDKKPCPQKGCKEIAEQVVLPSDASRYFSEPVVVHVAADGAYRFPGSATARVPKGFEKRELRTIREIEKFERDVNCRLSGEAHQHQENEERFFSSVRSELRSELRQRMQSMSERGRDFARLAMALNDQRRGKAIDPGFHTQILHFNQSNRDSHRDKETGWKSRQV